MQHIFLPLSQFQGGTATITGADHLHLARVLRARVGDRVVLLDGQGNAFRSELVTIGKSESVANILERMDLAPEPVVHLTIAQALGKGDKFEQVIQHGTEAGASAFIPLKSERCVASVPSAKATERVARWQQIAKSAAEQSGRVIIPSVAAPTTFADLITGVQEETRPSPAYLLLHPDLNAQSLVQALRMLDAKRPLALAVGPEGGWSPSEVSQAQAAKIPLVTLGPRVLRTETAALVAISQILYHFDSQR